MKKSPALYEVRAKGKATSKKRAPTASVEFDGILGMVFITKKNPMKIRPTAQIVFIFAWVG